MIYRQYGGYNYPTNPVSASYITDGISSIGKYIRGIMPSFQGVVDTISPEYARNQSAILGNKGISSLPGLAKYPMSDLYPNYKEVIGDIKLGNVMGKLGGPEFSSIQAIKEKAKKEMMSNPSSSFFDAVKHALADYKYHIGFGTGLAIASYLAHKYLQDRKEQKEFLDKLKEEQEEQLTRPLLTRATKRNTKIKTKSKSKIKRSTKRESKSGGRRSKKVKRRIKYYSK